MVGLSGLSDRSFGGDGRQATLAESFLADLEDLSDNEVEENENETMEGLEGELDGLDADNSLNYENLEAVATLVTTERYNRIVKAVQERLNTQVSLETAKLGAVDDNPEYKLIVECNQLAVDIDNEITTVHNFVRDKYRSKFPELESLVMHPVDYSRVVKTIANEMDMTRVDLDGLLPSATIMVVSVTGSTTNGKELDEATLAKVLQGCEMALQLDADKKIILEFVEDRMQWIAPNLSIITGSSIAAQLMGLAGGLHNLSRMPACNVQVLGAKKKRLDGFSTSAVNPHSGFLFASDIVQGVPPSLRQRTARLCAGKCTLMARMDAYGQDPTGQAGTKMREEMLAKIEKWQEPPPAKQPKPLPVPDLEPKKRRGGRKRRAQKERYGATDMMKLANRVNFNQPEEEIGLTGEGMGLLGSEGSGKLRVAMKQTKNLVKESKRYKDKLNKKYGSQGNASGLSSSVAFTPIQGIELVNPNAAVAAERSGTDSYFSETASFSKVRRLA